MPMDRCGTQVASQQSPILRNGTFRLPSRLTARKRRSSDTARCTRMHRQAGHLRGGMGPSLHHAIGAKRQISGVWGQSPQESHVIVMASWAGLSRISRIFSPISVAPGSRKPAAVTPWLCNHSINLRACVLLPHPSGPSNTMNRPLNPSCNRAFSKSIDPFRLLPSFLQETNKHFLNAKLFRPLVKVLQIQVRPLCDSYSQCI